MSNLKQYREKAGLSQSKLANLSGVNLRMVQKYENGERDINNAQALTLYKLAQALNCTIEDLLEIETPIIKPIDGDTFATKLNYLLRDSNITTIDLSQGLEVSRATISRWKNGHTTPNTSQIKEIANIFGVSYEWLRG